MGKNIAEGFVHAHWPDGQAQDIALGQWTKTADEKKPRKALMPFS